MTCPDPLHVLHVEKLIPSDCTSFFTFIFLTVPSQMSFKSNFILILKLEPFKILFLPEDLPLNPEKLEKEYPEVWSDFSLEVVDKTILMSDFGFLNRKK